MPRHKNEGQVYGGAGAIKPPRVSDPDAVASTDWPDSYGKNANVVESSLNKSGDRGYTAGKNRKTSNGYRNRG